jgi:isopentenyl phosphate kinase
VIGLARPCGSASVKLGGSLVTVKDRPYTIRMRALEEAASKLAAYHKRSRGGLLVFNGGGSFGHYEVSRLAGELGVEPSRLPAPAAPRVQAAMLELSMEVLRALLSAGIPASLHSTHTLCKCMDCSYEPLLRDLREGLVPQAYGDAIPCGGRLVIVSGDKLAVEAGLEAGVDCVVFIIDKPGILDGEGRVVEEVDPHNPPPSLGGGAPDVTGGLRSKLEWAARAASEGLRVYVTGVEGLLKVLLEGRGGSRIVV